MNAKALFTASVLDNPYIPHDPTIKQGRFLINMGLEGFYGGAGGGGKSDALLMAALQYVSEPGYAAILFRKTYTDLILPEALMDRARTWLQDTDAQWSEKEKTWHFPSGASLTFGYLENERDKFRYQSAEFQYIGFDELTQFSEPQYNFLFSRLRRLKDSEIPLRMRSASNPGGVGHEWVKARFIDPTAEQMKHEDRFFIPAYLEDNPFIDQESYNESLMRLDPVTREQMRHGNWDIAIKGEMFKREWFTFTDSPLSSMARRVRYWDLAATEDTGRNDPDYTSGTLMSKLNNEYRIEDEARVRLNPGDVERLILNTAQMDGIGTHIYMEQEGGSSGKSTIDHYSKLLAGYVFHGVHNTGSKVERARPFSAAASNGLVSVVTAPWTQELIWELEAFPTKGIHDDQVDSCSGAFHALANVQDSKRLMNIVTRRSR